MLRPYNHQLILNPLNMSLELIILIGALIVTWLVFQWLIKVVKASLSTAIAVAMVVLILQLSFGIGPQQLWQQIITLPETLLRIFQK